MRLATSETAASPSHMDWGTSLPFILVSAIWLAAGFCGALWFSQAHVWVTMGWLVLLWVLCMVDLYALSRAVGAALELAASAGEKRGALIIQASYWGVIKLTCLGILGFILSYGRAIPGISLVVGAGTLVVVPLFGGYGWSQKVLRHA